jgi:NAD(P)-dependent dehydrogenase (short-subunit alcohol dehydrogenase family)
MANETQNSNKNRGQIDLSGKVALITGSSSGFGAAIAILLSKYGAKVVVTGRNEQKVAQVGQQCNKVSPNSSKALLIVADITHDDYCKWLVDKTIEKFGKIDILVNNAGAGAITSITDPKLMETFDDVMRLDLRSVVYLTHMAVPYLEQTKGTIINISSVASMKPVIFLIILQFHI